MKHRRDFSYRFFPVILALSLACVSGCSGKFFSPPGSRSDESESGGSGSAGTDMAPGSHEGGESLPSSGAVQNLEPRFSRIYKNGVRATRDDFVDQSQEEGSLWASSGQTNYYFTKNKVRSPGDIIILTLESDLFKDIGTEIKRTLTPREKQNEVNTIQDIYRKKITTIKNGIPRDIVTTSAAAPVAPVTPPPAPAAAAATAQAAQNPNTPVLSDNPDELERQMARVTLKDVDLGPSLELKSGDTMMGEILERYPNGNYKIRSVKRVQYKNGAARLVSVVGIVRAKDINEDTDGVTSGKVYETRVEVAH